MTSAEKQELERLRAYRNLCLRGNEPIAMAVPKARRLMELENKARSRGK